MVIVYCEKCGKRVPEDQIQARTAVTSADNRTFCKDCAVTLPKPDRQTPPSGAKTPKPLQSRRPVTTVAKDGKAGKAEGFDRNWLYIGGGVAVLIVVVVVFMKSGSPPAVAATPTKTPPAAPTTPAVLTSTPATPASTRVTHAPNVPAATPASATAGPAVVDPVKERLRDSEREFELMRLQRGTKLLEEAREFFKATPTDPWTYKDKLTQVAGSYRGTPAGDEASKLLAELKMPDGPRPAPPAPPVAAPAAIPASWMGEPGADGFRPVLDGKTPPFRAIGFGNWKYDEKGHLVCAEKANGQTNFTFGDGDVRIRFQVNNCSWVSFAFRQTDALTGWNFGYDRRVMEALWGKPLEVVATCRGDDVKVTFNGQPVELKPGGRSLEGRIHINAVGDMRVFSIDYKPLDAK